MGRRFGQHFLMHAPTLAAIAGAATPLPAGATLIEIGPGQGALTQALLARYPGTPLHAYEVDAELRPHLEALKAQHPQLHVHWGDVLQTDAVTLPEGERIMVANIPYYISREICLWLPAHGIRQATLLTQTEFAEKITKHWQESALGVVVRTLYGARTLFPVPKQYFRPPPRVDSCVFQLERNEVPYSSRFVQVVFALYGARRKSARRTLDACGIVLPTLDEQLRPEHLQPAHWQAVAAASSALSPLS